MYCCISKGEAGADESGEGTGAHRELGESGGTGGRSPKGGGELAGSAKTQVHSLIYQLLGPGCAAARPVLVRPHPLRPPLSTRLLGAAPVPGAVLRGPLAAIVLAAVLHVNLPLANSGCPQRACCFAQLTGSWQRGAVAGVGGRSGSLLTPEHGLPPKAVSEPSEQDSLLAVVGGGLLRRAVGEGHPAAGGTLVQAALLLGVTDGIHRVCVADPVLGAGPPHEKLLGQGPGVPVVVVVVGLGGRVRDVLLVLGGLSGVGVAQSGSGSTAGAQTLLLAAVFILCHLWDAAQLLVEADLRGQLEDPLQDLLVAVGRLHLAQLQGALGRKRNADGDVVYRNGKSEVGPQGEPVAWKRTNKRMK